MEFVRETLDLLLRDLFTEILRSGSNVDATKGDNLELIGIRLELTNPLARLSRTQGRGQAISCLGELLWYISGSDDAEIITYYLPEYKRYVRDERIEGAYGPRLFGEGFDDQVNRIIEMLSVKPHTRRAVIQLFDRRDLADGSEEVPCTCTLQFLLRNDRLHLVVYMRSNDAYIGLPHDVFAFTMIQELVARSLGVELGTYVHTVGSMHLYQSNVAQASAFLTEGLQATEAMPAMPAGDPWASIRALLNQEREIRVRSTEAPSTDDLRSTYWDDLARLLLAYSMQDPNELRALRATFANDYFKLYIFERQLRKDKGPLQ